MTETAPPAFVPAGFTLPAPPSTPLFALEALTLAHNEADLEAWSSSVAHIHATPGFDRRAWPDEPMTPERNAADLRAHLEDFALRRGFTYSVVSVPDREVIGCVYIYPAAADGDAADVRSWVRSSRADLDRPLYETVTEWLDHAWPFATVNYAPRAPVE